MALYPAIILLIRLSYHNNIMLKCSPMCIRITQTYVGHDMQIMDVILIYFLAVDNNYPNTLPYIYE